MEDSHQCRGPGSPALSAGSPAPQCDKDSPRGAVPHGAGAGCLLPALVTRGPAVPTLASPGTPLAAAATENRHETTHSTSPTPGTLEP